MTYKEINQKVEETFQSTDFTLLKNQNIRYERYTSNTTIVIKRILDNHYTHIWNLRDTPWVYLTRSRQSILEEFLLTLREDSFKCKIYKSQEDYSIL